MKLATVLNLLLLLITPLLIDSFGPTASAGIRQHSGTRRNGNDVDGIIAVHHMAPRSDNDRSRQRRRSWRLPSSSMSSNPFPPILPGQSLAHNLHELVLGVLINSDGQNVLSKKSMRLPPKKSSRRGPGKPSLTEERSVIKVEKFDRIPTWPIQNGIRFNAISRINPDLAAGLEHKYGGADCPNLWLQNAKQTSPFLMMCHHNHSFDLNDPVRLLEKRLNPEGFPSHAHQGMSTVTICIRGGMIHRDSLGNKQVFGNDNNGNNQRKRYNGKHTQWLTFGRGIVHELMWDNEPRNNNEKEVIHQEIYQIWIDLPRDKRYMEPRVELLGSGGKDEEEEDTKTPTVIDKNHGTHTTIIAGQHNGVSAPVDTISNLTILRVEMNKPYQTWTHQSSRLHSTMIAYVRTGAIRIGNVRVPPHCTAYLSPSSPNNNNGKEEGKDIVQIKCEGNGADFLLMSGQPLNQEVVARGSMVTETHEELQRAYHDYEQGRMGVPWSETCSDVEWRRHLRKQLQ